MNVVLLKIFRLDDYDFEEEVLFPLNKLYLNKKKHIMQFYIDLLKVSDSTGIYKTDIDKLFKNDWKTSSRIDKFRHHSMCLSIQMVNFIYGFMKKNSDKFPESKVGIDNLIGDIDYMNDTLKRDIFQEAQPL